MLRGAPPALLRVVGFACNIRCIEQQLAGTQRMDAKAEDVAHTVSRIEQATVETQPFPHLVVRNFLPDDLYREALARWPADTSFASRNHMDRVQFNLTRQLSELPEALQPTWSRLLGLSDAVNRALYRKFQPHFSHKFVPLFGARWRETTRDYSTAFRRVQLAQYTGRGALLPHVDSVRLVVNSFLYASESGQPEPSLGTVLYRSFGLMLTDNNFRIPDATSSRYLAPDVVVPYEANCLLSFVNTPFSFHGVEPFDLGSCKRRLILFSPTLNESVERIEADFRARPVRMA